MWIQALSLTDFRSWEQVSVLPDLGVNTFIGSNGQGKTNIVEAIGYLATLSSHRVATDAPLVRHGCQRAVISARVATGNYSPRSVQVEINARGSNRARLNGSQVPRLADVLAVVKAVTFAPEDLALVKGDPATRRTFLDGLTIQLRPRLAAVLADYDKVLRQRSSLLKSAGALRGPARERALESLFVWDERLASLGGTIRHERVKLVQQLAPPARALYASVSDATTELGTSYVGEGLAAPGDDVDDFVTAMTEAMQQVRAKEVERGVSLVGPHRDDIELSLGPGPAKGYASHGESWSVALALRLAQAQVLAAAGDEAILIVDDVFAELDAGRRQRLVQLLAGASQVFVTAAVESDVPAGLGGARFAVGDQKVERV